MPEENGSTDDKPVIPSPWNNPPYQPEPKPPEPTNPNQGQKQ